MDERKLAEVDLFAGLSRADRQRVAQTADEVDVEAGRRLVHEGDFAWEVFVVEDGTAEVTREGRHVADLGPGDVIGEMGIVGNARRNATVVATSPMTLIVMTEQDFRGVRRAMPAVAERIERGVKERCAALLGE